MDHDYYMGLALELSRKALANGDLPVGSLIVRDNKVIGSGSNHARSINDPVSHGEIEAIRDACHSLGTTDLSDASCYTVMEPCPMCCWALLEAGVSQVILGARHAEMRRTDYGGYSLEKLVEMTGRELDVVTRIRTAECEALRRSDPKWIEPK